MITHNDLNWWLERSAQLDWTWAKTYADTAPHDYVVDGRTKDFTKDEYVRAGRVIHTFGVPAKFYAMTSIYLTSPDGRLKWWTMDDNVADTNLINRATTERLYGVQNAPSTDSGTPTAYDAVATDYDAANPASPEFVEALRAAVAELRGEHTPAVLDVGCGTGRVLDLGLTRAERYAGVDPSAPMLNQLVRKHPGVGAIYPMSIEQALAERTFTPGQFEIVTILLDESEELEPTVTDAVTTIASRGVITAIGESLEVTHV